MNGRGKLMDFQKLILYMNILGICLPIAISYEVITNIIFGLPIKPVTIGGLAFGYVVMFKCNPLFQELMNKWTKKRK
jgi:hypothetical protein